MRLAVRAPLLLPGLFARLCARLAALLGPPARLAPWRATYPLECGSGGVTVALETSTAGGSGPLPGVWAGAFVIRAPGNAANADSAVRAADLSCPERNAEERAAVGARRNVAEALWRRAAVSEAVALARAAVDSACYDLPALRLGEWVGDLCGLVGDASSEVGAASEGRARSDEFEASDEGRALRTPPKARADEGEARDDASVGGAAGATRTPPRAPCSGAQGAAEESGTPAEGPADGSAEASQPKARASKGDGLQGLRHRPGLRAQLTVNRVKREAASPRCSCACAVAGGASLSVSISNDRSPLNCCFVCADPLRGGG